MERITRMSLLLLGFVFLNYGATYGEWIEKKEPLVNNVGWGYLTASGNWLIYGSANSTYLYDLATGKKGLLIDKGGLNTRAIYGDNMVFQDSGKIYLCDLKKKKIKEIGEGTTAPAIYLDTVVYGGGNVLIIYNIKNNKDRRIPLQRVMAGIEQIGPGIYKDTVVWLAIREDGDAELLSYNLKEKGGQVKKLYEIPAKMIVNLNLLKFQDGVVLISTQTDVYIYSMNDGTFKRLTGDGKRVYTSNINEGKVVWDSDGDAAINLYDIADGRYEELMSEGALVYSVTNTRDKAFFQDGKRHEIGMFEYKKTEKR